MQRRRLLGLVAATAVACAPAGSAAVPVAAHAASPAAPKRELFRFHVDLWANLHQVLFHEALLPRPGFSGPKSLAHHSVASIAELAPDEVASWHDAVGYYDAHFTTHSMFTDEFMYATRGLSAAGSAPALPTTLSLPPDWLATIGRAAPVYRARFWPAHEREGRAYVDAIRPGIAAHGAWLADRLAALYATPWPDEPVDVEVTPAVAPFGAATIGEPPFHEAHLPLITVSSEDPGYAGGGGTGLEMIFHEASHLLVDRVQAALDASAKRQGKTLPRGLWHFLLFYTAGHATQERLGAAYVPYAERPEHHIFDGDFAPLLPVLVRAWQPYLDGRVTLDQGVDAVVAAF